jgi:L-seryl-tRNA(Ser) seleniumtransferase
MKAGKEEIAGLLAAVERFVNLDHASLHGQWLTTVEAWHQGLMNLDGVSLRPEALNEAGQPVPRLYVGINDTVRAASTLAALTQANPRVAVHPDLRNGTPHGFWIGPDLLQGDEAQIVLDTVHTAITSSASK